jgi:hypothetical protein
MLKHAYGINQPNPQDLQVSRLSTMSTPSHHHHHHHQHQNHQQKLNDSVASGTMLSPGKNNFQVIANGGPHMKHSSPAQAVVLPHTPTTANGAAAETAANTPRYKNLVSNYLFPRGNTGVTELLLALSLLCLISLILGLLALSFLLRMTPLDVTTLVKSTKSKEKDAILPDANELVIIHEVAVALTALTLSLDLCCLLSCSAQMLFALLLLKTSNQGRTR